jgi:hypothetical protein
MRPSAKHCRNSLGSTKQAIQSSICDIASGFPFTKSISPATLIHFSLLCSFFRHSEALRWAPQYVRANYYLGLFHDPKFGRKNGGGDGVESERYYRLAVQHSQRRHVNAMKDLACFLRVRSRAARSEPHAEADALLAVCVFEGLPLRVSVRN